MTDEEFSEKVADPYLTTSFTVACQGEIVKLATQIKGGDKFLTKKQREVVDKRMQDLQPLYLEFIKIHGKGKLKRLELDDLESKFSDYVRSVE